MVIKLKCPVCNARNDSAPDNQTCRRCGEDLSLLYRLKGYSYKYRIIAAQNLLSGNGQQLRRLLASAVWLCKEQ